MKPDIRTHFTENLHRIEKKLPLEKFIPAAFIVFLLTVFILSLITYSYIEEYKKDNELINHTQHVIKKNENVGYMILEIPLLRRAYVITGEKKYLDEYYITERNIRKEIDTLKSLTSTNQNQQNLLRSLDSILNKEISMLNISIESYPDLEFSRNLQIEVTNRTDLFLEQISSILKQIGNEEIRLLNERNNKAGTTNYHIQIFILITGIFSFLVIGMSLFLSKNLIKNKNKAEQLLIRSYEELEVNVNTRTLELQESNKKLRDLIVVRGRIEKSLRESEHRFKIMADSAPVLIWMSDTHKSCYYFNKVWFEYTGRTMEQEYGDGWIESIHKDDVQKFTNELSIAFDKIEKFELEFRLKNHNGEYCWVLNKGVPRFEDNEFIGFIGCLIEIDEIKRNEKYFKIQYRVSKTLEEAKTIEEASKEILRVICEEINWGFGILWTFNRKQNMLNKTAFYSSTPVNGELLDYTFNIVESEGLAEEVLNSGKSKWVIDVKNDKNFTAEKPDSKLGWGSAFAVPVLKGSEPISVLEFFSKNIINPRYDLLDVLEVIGRHIVEFMERKKAEEELRESYILLEDRVKERTLELAHTLTKLLNEIKDREKIQNQLKLFAHAIKTVKEYIFITDLDYKTIFVNQSFESMYGYHLEELINKKIPVLFSEYVPENLRKEISSTSIRGGWKGELKSKSKDGKEFYINLSTTVIRNDEGKIQAVIGICQDISEMKAAKELIIKRNSLLKLLNDIIIETNKSFNINDSLLFAIDKVCQYTSFQIGHCFLLKNKNVLISTRIWNSDLQEEFGLFKEISENKSFEEGEGLPGKCLEESRSLWLNLDDWKNEKTYGWEKVSRKSGINTGIWIPIMKQDEVVGVFEFFHKDLIPLDNEILHILNNIGVEIGNLIERQQILEKITASEKILNEAQHIAKLGSWEWNIVTDNVFWSDELHNIYEISKDDYNSTFEGYIERIYPEDAEKAKEIIENAISNRQPFEFYHRIVTPSGKIKIIKSQGEVYVDDEGKAVRMFGTGLDITALKMAEEKIKESERKLIEAQKIARLGSWEWKVENNELIWSDEMYEIFEIERNGSSLNFETTKDFVINEDKKIFENLKNTFLQSKNPYNCSYRIKTRSGKIKTLNSHSQIQANEKDEITRVIGVTIDVTEIKEAEERTRISMNQLKKSHQMGKMGTWETNLNSGAQTWSDEVYALYGYRPEEIEPKYKNIRELIHPEDVKFVDSINKRFEKKPEPISFNYRIITRDKELKHLYTEILIEYDDLNKPKKILGTVQDLTELKLIEDELGKTNIKLVEAYKELIHNEKLAALGRFASGIAHEIRNPLANISALTQLLSKNNYDSKSQKHINYILVNTDLANKIITDLLDFTSPKDLIFKEECLEEVINNIIGSIEPRCTEKNIIIEKYFQSNILPFAIDRIKFENALLNFISNAIDAMNNGGELKFVLREDKIKSEILINIQDTGIGIPEENLDKILEPFYTTKERGTGLGLGLAYQTIKSHQGSLNIRSKLGHGTTIEIKLPIKNIFKNGENINH